MRPVLILSSHGGGRIPDYHEPVFTGETVVRDSLGRANNNGSIRWCVVACNNPDCTYRVLVAAEEVARLATEAAR